MELISACSNWGLTGINYREIPRNTGVDYLYKCYVHTIAARSKDMNSIQRAIFIFLACQSMYLGAADFGEIDIETLVNLTDGISNESPAEAIEILKVIENITDAETEERRVELAYAHNNLAVAYSALRDAIGFDKHTEIAHTLNPIHISIRFNRAIALTVREEYQKALSLINQVLDEDSDYSIPNGSNARIWKEYLENQLEEN